MSLINKQAVLRVRGAQGDPGLFSALGKLAKGALGLVTPPPVKAAVNVLGGLKSLPLPKGVLLPGGGAGFFAPPKALPSFGGVTGGGSSTMPMIGATRTRKRPTMNYGNGKAIRRAARRLEGAEKMFRRVFSIRHGKAPGKLLPKGRGR